ncbi:YbiU family protein [Salmonella enterica]|uniref:YbiU family protein n=1 Tax=Salmonella enterica TaxID=28901 RepID=UPI000E1B79A3|nr:DUF1479 family protein [Salmonella enterica subsp. salamae]EEL7719221.1 DUF1479 family protein [Salmonella enterica]ECC1655897.1 DUF1479 family protein [Salmonella enterica subsp. salamae]ECD9413195.1 DUF1479 family protein [Salmonella enterica subsp. salamae]ECF5930871.1 DUF1479 family protein [Salmonella enterica subsp. salamae]
MGAWGCSIPAAPRCAQNPAYANKVRAALERGASAGNFPHEGYEADRQRRFTLDDLHARGKRALGMESEERTRQRCAWPGHMRVFGDVPENPASPRFRSRVLSVAA